MKVYKIFINKKVNNLNLKMCENKNKIYKLNCHKKDITQK